jgi:hypothetical protein
VARIDAEQNVERDLARLPIREFCLPIGRKALGGKMTNVARGSPDMPMVTFDVIASIESSSVATAVAASIGIS